MAMLSYPFPERTSIGLPLFLLRKFLIRPDHANRLPLLPEHVIIVEVINRFFEDREEGLLSVESIRWLDYLWEHVFAL